MAHRAAWPAPEVVVCPASGGNCTTVAGGTGEGSGVASLRYPTGVIIASDGRLVIADSHNSRIQACVADGTGNCTTLAGGYGFGDGPRQMSWPTGVALAANGDLVVADMKNHRVLRCLPDGSRNCTVVAGGWGGGSNSQQLYFPQDVAVADNGDYVVADVWNHRIQRCPADDSGICLTVAGGKGRGNLSWQLDNPWSVSLGPGPNESYVVADYGNHRVQLCPFSGTGN
ncbi:unnamed protein product [Polarella glacialis]|nr:unnamed protein product [Polarella glacialis]